MAELTSPIELLNDVGNEFGSSTKPATDSLVNYHNQVFGSGTKNLLQFIGTGKPVIGNAGYSATNVDENSATLNASINFNGGLSQFTYYFQYDTDSNFGSPATTTQQSQSSTSILQNVSGLSSGTTYYFRLVVFNNYCSNSNDHTVDTLNNGSFTTDSATCSVGAPNVDSAVFQNFGTVQISWTEPSPTPGNGYNIYYSLNGGAFQFKTNVPEGTTSYQHDCSDGDFSNGDDVQWQVTSECSNGVEGGSDNTATETISTC